jgi:hypothetical protein
VKRDWLCFQPFIICRLVLPRLLRNSCHALGWALLSLALFQAVTWFFWCPHAKDGRVLEARVTFQTILGVPLFLLGSACFLFVSRKSGHRWARWLYRFLLGIAVLVSIIAFTHLRSMEGSRGWVLVLGGQE